MILRALHRHFHRRDFQTFSKISKSRRGIAYCFVPVRTPCHRRRRPPAFHYNDVIMGAIVSQITSLTIIYSIVYSDADQRKHQSFASLAFVRGIHRGPVNSPHKWPVTRKMFPFDDVIICSLDNFLRTIFRISSVLAGVMALRYRLPDPILVNFNRDLDLEFSSSNMKFTNLNLSQNVPIVTKQKAVIWIEL